MWLDYLRGGSECARGGGGQAQRPRGFEGRGPGVGRSPDRKLVNLRNCIEHRRSHSHPGSQFLVPLQSARFCGQTRRSLRRQDQQERADCSCVRARVQQRLQVSSPNSIGMSWKAVYPLVQACVAVSSVKAAVRRILFWWTEENYRTVSCIRRTYV